MTQNFAIEVINLSKSFNGKQILNDVSFKIKKGESLGIIGCSGTGKSVLIKCIMGIIEPDSGEIYINGNPVNYSLNKIGFLFQGGALFDSLNILDNITFYSDKVLNLSYDERLEIAKNNLNKVGLDDRVLKLYPSELSGGMQKRVALARAIASTPEIIFFDEPTTGLDPIMSNTIASLIHNISTSLCATTITITHDINALRTIASKIIMLHEGKVIFEGNRSELDSSNSEYVDQFISGNPIGPI
jgi:phospholipid/cholesterol/gamma-HCH transport system ATP-binding protein